MITHHAGINIYFNGDRLRLLALTGHTDGDTAVYFERANVLHTGTCSSMVAFLTSTWTSSVSATLPAKPGCWR